MARSRTASPYPEDHLFEHQSTEVLEDAGYVGWWEKSGIAGQLRRKASCSNVSAIARPEVSVSGPVLGFELKRGSAEEGVDVEVRVIPAHVRGQVEKKL